MSEPASIAPPRYVCSRHGATNQIIGLNRTIYCLDCLSRMASAQLIPVAARPVLA